MIYIKKIKIKKSFRVRNLGPNATPEDRRTAAEADLAATGGDLAACGAAVRLVLLSRSRTHRLTEAGWSAERVAALAPALDGLSETAAGLVATLVRERGYVAIIAIYFYAPALRGLTETAAGL
eukprot:SAG11_NODE_2550_length_3230_cov_2.417758_3_plen_122_part_01